MPRVKIGRLLAVVSVLICLSLLYLLTDSRRSHSHQLDGEAAGQVGQASQQDRMEHRQQRKESFQALPTVNPNYRRVKLDQLNANQGAISRDVHSREYHQPKRDSFGKLSKNSKETKFKPETNNGKRVLASTSSKPLPPSVDGKKTSKSKSNVQSFTEYIKTELEKQRKRYMLTHSNMSAIILGEKFDVEAYLSPQRFNGKDGEAMSRFQFNQQASDNTAYNRTLWDIRNPLCKGKYESPAIDINKLPSTSVIICFHNEARSALLRTIYSVLSRSPAQVLKEIVLVDDFSDNIGDGRPLADIPRVNLIRLNKREGLIRARLVGARAAKGQVLTFLDSHCEVTPGWLEPLLVRIQQDKTHVVSPVIDIINKNDMRYNQANSNIRGGFDYNLHFKWDNLNAQELSDRRHDSSAPIQTPAIAGGLFSVDKTYFEHIGSYDEMMEIWGGENVELSMRVWMCGGRLEIVPCSHVGHIFRSSMPYSFGKGQSYHTTVTRNLRRTAEVWMGDYKYLFYRANVAAKAIPYGNITSRLELKRKLKCKSFNWFIDNIYPDFLPGQKDDVVTVKGRLRHGAKGGCLQSQNPTNGMYKLVLKPCHNEDRDNNWSFTTEGHIKHQTLCLTAKRKMFPPKVSLSFCLASTDSSQAFQWTKTDFRLQIKHKSSGLCLSTQEEADTNITVGLQSCDTSSKSQNWLLIF